MVLQTNVFWLLMSPHLNGEKKTERVAVIWCMLQSSLNAVICSACVTIEMIAPESRAFLLIGMVLYVCIGSILVRDVTWEVL